MENRIKLISNGWKEEEKKDTEAENSELVNSK